MNILLCWEKNVGGTKYYKTCGRLKEVHQMLKENGLVKKIKETYDKLLNQGELLTESQLKKYLTAFKKKFGPDVLRGLDGEILLNTMHDHGSRDSLVYWLEFKNDDEFRNEFGSIAGGSALKFGIYVRKETGAWMTGSPQQQVEISIDEAVEYARKHRDQLIKGCELLEALPVNASLEDYKILQNNMSTLEISNTAWGHKYFSMLYPDKLDDFHAPNYQRFYLYKLLQDFSDPDGRYVLAYYYIAIANQLKIPVNSLTGVLYNLFGKPHRYWRVGTSDGSKPRNKWDMMRSSECVAIGWPALGDLTSIEYKQEDKNSIKKLIKEKYYQDSPSMAGRKGAEVFRFVTVMKTGDIILASDGSQVLGVGKIVGDYFYDSASDFPHRRPVEWLSLDEWTIPEKEGLQTTVYEIKKTINIVQAEKIIFSNTHPITKPPLKKLFGLSKRIQLILDRKGQVILYGPPGTGKTYWAETTALDLAANSCYGKWFSELDDTQKKFITGDGTNKGLVRMCTFHPTYGYEDFIEGYRPEKVNGQMIFSLKDGIFKSLCEDARKNPGLMYYLIIDEINRGDISRIFGELITVLEMDKRGKPLLLPLRGVPFQVPDNIRIIGTMNTADRSIALLDTALRRRFGFIELMPDYTLFENTVIEGIPLAPWLEELNSRICDHIGRDARNLQIGHSFFLEKGKPIGDFTKFARVIQEDIIPLLEEYCYEDYEALSKILGESLVDQRNQKIRHELFEDARQDNLKQALLSPSPDISTTKQAITSKEDIGEDEEIDGNTEDSDKDL